MGESKPRPEIFRRAPFYLVAMGDRDFLACGQGGQNKKLLPRMGDRDFSRIADDYKIPQKACSSKPTFLHVVRVFMSNHHEEGGGCV